MFEYNYHNLELKMSNLADLISTNSPITYEQFVFLQRMGFHWSLLSLSLTDIYN